MSKKYILILLLLVGAILIFMVVRKNPLERFLEHALEACSNEDRESLLELISEEYLDQHHLSRTNIDEILQRLFQNFDNIKIVTDHITSQQLQNMGTISFDFKVIATIAPSAKLIQDLDTSIYGGRPYYLVGSPTQFGHIVLELVQEKNSWRLKTITEINIGMPIPDYGHQHNDAQ
jgi:hypothetical protein